MKCNDNSFAREISHRWTRDIGLGHTSIQLYSKISILYKDHHRGYNSSIARKDTCRGLFELTILNGCITAGSTIEKKEKKKKARYEEPQFECGTSCTNMRQKTSVH